MKRNIVVLLVLSLLLQCLPLNVFATETVQEPLSPTHSIGEVGGYLEGNLQAVKHLYEDKLFTSPTGHGFAAENGNNLIDKFKGLDATVVGNDFVENGPDRKIINRDGSIVWIQDKYYSSASQSVNAAFDGETKLYRYFDASGSPMKLEVPADQYDDAVKVMRDKIRQGLVPNVSDPDEAVNIIKKGNLTYKQAVNITKAGNIDSLLYDSSTGIITATCGAGISFVIDYVCCRLNGNDAESALKNASLNGLKTGGVVFATYVISSQIAKTGAVNAFVPTAEAIANTLGDDVCKAILTRAGIDTLGMTSKTLTNNVAKIISKELIADGVLIIVLTGVDVVDLFRGRISKEELLKNLTVTIISVAAGTAGGIGGGALGTLIAPGVGTTVGTIVGSTVVGGAAGILSDLLISKFYESDAEEMYQIISDEFLVLCEEYLISETEGIVITDALKNELVGDTLKDMYASENRTQFARQLLEPLFTDQVKARTVIETPTEDEIRNEYKTSLQGIIFIH